MVSELGSCHDVCEEGETRVTRVTRDSLSNATNCFTDAAIEILKDCEGAGWLGRDSTSVFISSGELGCQIGVALYTGSSLNSGDICDIEGRSVLLCTDMFGDPPVFPKAADHTNVKADGSGGDSFVANCDRDGNVPGGYPPDHNLNGETECSCDLDSHIGEWPDCVAAPTLTRAQREAVGICTSQGWTISTTTTPIKCEIPLTSDETDTDYDGCFVIASTGTDMPLCDDVFGEEYAFPPALPPLVQNLYDGFQLINFRRSDTLGTVALAYANAVLGRYNGEPDYINEAISQVSREQLQVEVGNEFILIQVFRDNGIPFSLRLGASDNEIIARIRAAFNMIPVREPYVFNCGEGMIPARANLNGATECVRQPYLRLRLRLFLEGPLR